MDLISLLACISMLSLVPHVTGDVYSETLFSLGTYLEKSQINQSEAEDLVRTLEERSLKSLLVSGLQDLEETETISATCQQHVGLLVVGLAERQEWALRMLDAAGKLPSGLLTAVIIWIGSYDECVNITATTYSGPNETVPIQPFKGRYCKTGIQLGKVNAAPLGEASAIPPGYATLGVCMPNTCTVNDVNIIMKTVLGLIGIANTTINTAITQCQYDHLDIDGRAAFAIVVLSILVSLVVIGTLYDVFVIHKLHISAEEEIEDDVKDAEETAPLISQQSHDVHGNNLNIRYRGYGAGETGARLESPTEKNIQEQEESGIGLSSRLLIAFSVYTNGSKLLSTRTQSGNLGPVNGIRFISLTWVILGHSYAFILYNGKNTLPFIVEKLQDLSFMFMINATVSVDSFFLLSGLLVGYLSLKELKKVGGVKKFRWGMFYFHRFWRLTPPYGLVMLLYIPLLKYWSNGPFWPQGGVENNYCENTWYKNLLYVNNLFSAVDNCMIWSWYLANDMQFYILSPLFLIPLYWSGVLGTLVCFIVLLGSWIAAGAISSINDYPMTLFGGKGGIASGNIVGYFDDLYDKPWTRIGPYIVGMLLGYVLYVTECKPKLTRIQNLLGWLLAAVCCLSVLYGNYGTISGTNVSSKQVIALYTALARSVWALGVAWVIYACATRRGGIVSAFLSWKLFVPLSRLTYVAYLIHPVVMEVYYLSKRETTYITDFEIVYFFFGHLIVSYTAAFVLSLVFEAPFMGLEKALFRRERRH